MEKKIYLIYRDSCDDACEIKGYIFGTEEDAEKYCNELPRDIRSMYDEWWWEELDNLLEEKQRS